MYWQSRMGDFFICNKLAAGCKIPAAFFEKNSFLTISTEVRQQPAGAVRNPRGRKRLYAEKNQPEVDDTQTDHQHDFERV